MQPVSLTEKKQLAILRKMQMIFRIHDEIGVFALAALPRIVKQLPEGDFSKAAYHVEVSAKTMSKLLLFVSVTPLDRWAAGNINNRRDTSHTHGPELKDLSQDLLFPQATLLPVKQGITLIKRMETP